ncbi:hypothetical protein DFH11DRAFT_1727921 [Phellopilus nigrolimitatus]|nr:hypothetical protein DFH11DRAFT_1727921 [Phellopilus nigrolimitatus]
MRVSALLSILSVALSVSALQVTNPSTTSGWTSTGSNTLSWNRVSTDPTNFTVVLTNTDRSVMPTNNLVLANFVDATSGSSLAIVAPSGGFNVGGNFRVNLVQTPDELNSIYAQSNTFNITAGSSSSASGASTVSVSALGSTSGTGTSSSVKGTTATISPTGASGTSSTGTNTNLNPSSTSTNAAPPRYADLGLLGAMLLLGGFIA